MVTSMTGYGEGEARTEQWSAWVRVKTLNHRYLDIVVKGLEDYDALELSARRLIESTLHRGRVEVRVSLTPTDDRGLQFDHDTARDHWNALETLVRDLGLGEPVTLDHLIRFGGAFVPLPPDAEGAEPALSEALQSALEAVQGERAREGAALGQELTSMLQALGRDQTAVREAVPELKARYRESLQTRLEELAPNVEFDPGRLEQEVALVAERGDITEELDRLEVHRQAAEAALRDENGAMGRRLDFLGQEMYREINTMTSKAKDGDVAQRLVDMKAQVEQFREQVRNIE
ncbi:MAG: YicC/YloC family endoribonuclease [Candidatus Bipolaricaulia bacterium]